MHIQASNIIGKGFFWMQQVKNRCHNDSKRGNNNHILLLLLPFDEKSNDDDNDKFWQSNIMFPFIFFWANLVFFKMKIKVAKNIILGVPTGKFKVRYLPQKTYIYTFFLFTFLTFIPNYDCW